MPRVIRVGYFGDSITYGLGHDHKGVGIEKRWTSLVDMAFKDMESEFFIYSKNFGVNGDTTRNGLERLPDIYAFNPDIITIQFGLNDCNYWLSDNGVPRVTQEAFRANMIELIDKLKASGIRYILLFTNHQIPVVKPTLEGHEYNYHNHKYNDIIREIADKTGGRFCDIEKTFPSNRIECFLDENGRWIHLSEIGNRVYADLVFPYIEKMIASVMNDDR